MRGISYMYETECARSVKAKYLTTFQEQRKLVCMEQSKEERAVSERWGWKNRQELYYLNLVEFINLSIKQWKATKGLWDRVVGGEGV